MARASFRPAGLMARYTCQKPMTYKHAPIGPARPPIYNRHGGISDKINRQFPSELRRADSAPHQHPISGQQKDRSAHPGYPATAEQPNLRVDGNSPAHRACLPPSPWTTTPLTLRHPENRRPQNGKQRNPVDQFALPESKPVFAPHQSRGTELSVDRSGLLLTYRFARPRNFIRPAPIISGLEKWSEWQDLNLRPPRPERGALPG